MADLQLIQRLTGRVRIWNRWYRQHLPGELDLRRAELPESRLSAALLPGANLQRANL